MSSDAALYIVATPIGNLADMVPRALEVLQSVSLIAAEDTRHSQRLLQHFGIRNQLKAYHDHQGAGGEAYFLQRLQAGESVALISDAGTPLISDPGYRLVDAALTAGIKVVPIPGPCAVVAALSVSGLPSDRFSFEGFLPAKAQARLQRLQALAEQEQTLIFYEAPHRLLDSLGDMRRAFGAEREAVLVRELTKLHETVSRKPLADLFEWVAADSNQQRGECVVLVRGAQTDGRSVTAEAERALRLLMQELPLKKAAAVASQLSGVKKNALYDFGLGLKDE